MKKIASKIKLNSNELLKICLITVLSILLFNRKKYTFPIFIHIVGTSILSFSFTNNIINSLLISLLVTYVVLTFFYKIKIERFIFGNIFNKTEEEKENITTTQEPLDIEEICKIEDDSLVEMPKKKWSCDKNETTTTTTTESVSENPKFTNLTDTLNNKFKNML